MRQNLKTQIVTKLEKNCDKTQNSNCDKTQKPKLENLNCDKTKKI